MLHGIAVDVQAACYLPDAILTLPCAAMAAVLMAVHCECTGTSASSQAHPVP